MALSPKVAWYSHWISKIKGFICPCWGAKHLINAYNKAPMKIVND